MPAIDNVESYRNGMLDLAGHFLCGGSDTAGAVATLAVANDVNVDNMPLFVADFCGEWFDVASRPDTSSFGIASGFILMAYDVSSMSGYDSTGLPFFCGCENIYTNERNNNNKTFL